MAFTLPLVIAATLWVGRTAKSAGWLDRKPEWLLRLELGIDSRRPAALNELQKRTEILARGVGYYEAHGPQPYTIAEPAVHRLLDVAANSSDFDDSCRDFLLSSWYFLRPPARHDAAAKLMALLDDDHLTIATRAARVLREAGEQRETGDIDTELRRAANLLIARQGNRARTWDDEFVLLLEHSRECGALSDAAWSRYARQIVDPKLCVRSKIRAGDALPYGMTWGKLRGSDRFAVSERWERCRIGDIDVRSTEDFIASQYVDDSDLRTGDLRSESALALSAGQHMLSAAVSFRIAERDPSTGEDGRILVEWRDEWELPVEVVPAGQDVVRGVAAPALPDAFARTSRIDAHIKSGTLWVVGDVGPLATNVAARATIEEPATGHRWDVHRVVIRSGHREKFGIALNRSLPTVVYPAKGAVINLVLEPDPEAARETTDVTEYADVTLRIEGLTIGSW